MPAHSHDATDSNGESSPLAKRLRSLGFIIDDECLRPTPERLGHLHLHVSDACSLAYCASCVKPLCLLNEVVPNRSRFEGESEVAINDLCLVCAHCGVIYESNLMEDDSGVLCHLIVEQENLIDALRVFEGVPLHDREHVAIARALDRHEAMLKQGLESIALLRRNLASGEAAAKQPESKKKGGTLLHLVTKESVSDASGEPESDPPAA